MWYGIAADIVVGIHLAYVGYVVLGQLAIIIASPESLTAIRAALRNDMQRMFNIALGSYTIVDAVALMNVTDKVQVGLFVKNLTNEVALYDGLGTFQDPEAVVAAQPRTIGVNARIAF